MCDKAYVIKLDVDDPYHELLDRINDLIDILIKTIKNIDTKTSNVLVKKALNYISINYNKAITLNNVAAYLEVTPGYISNLLSSYTSKNFTDLVTECRIEKAKVCFCYSTINLLLKFCFIVKNHQELSVKRR